MTKTYISQQNQLNENINTWSGFISVLSQIIDNYDSNINYIYDQMEQMDKRIKSLELDISTEGTVQFEYPSITVVSSPTQYYNKNIGVFTGLGVDNLYIYANKSVARMTINGNTVTSNNYICQITNPSKTEILTIHTDNLPIITGLKLGVSTSATGNMDWNATDGTVMSVNISYQAQSITITKPSTYANTIGAWQIAESKIVAPLNGVQTNMMVAQSLKSQTLPGQILK